MRMGRWESGEKENGRERRDRPNPQSNHTPHPLLSQPLHTVSSFSVLLSSTGWFYRQHSTPTKYIYLYITLTTWKKGSPFSKSQMSCTTFWRAANLLLVPQGRRLIGELALISFWAYASECGQEIIISWCGTIRNEKKTVGYLNSRTITTGSLIATMFNITFR